MSATLPAEPVTLELAGQTIAVTEVTIGQIPTLARLVTPMLSDITVMVESLLAGRHIDWQHWLAWMAKSGDDAIALVAVAASQPVNVVAQLGPHDFVLLALTVLRVNLDFFVRSFPALIQAMGTMASQTLGLQPSSDSSAPDTTATA